MKKILITVVACALGWSALAEAQGKKGSVNQPLRPGRTKNVAPNGDMKTKNAWFQARNSGLPSKGRPMHKLGIRDKSAR